MEGMRKKVNGGMEREWKDGWNAAWRERTGRGLIPFSREVFESAALLDDGAGELAEDAVHVGAPPWPHALQEANMAAVAGNEHGQVGVLLYCLHRDG